MLDADGKVVAISNVAIDLVAVVASIAIVLAMVAIIDVVRDRW